MKKLISIILILLISINLFCSDSSTETPFEPILVYEADSELCSLHYAIYEDEDDTSIVKLTDDSNYGLEIRVLFDDIEEAFDFFIESESDMYDDFSYYYKDELIQIKKSPVMYLILNDGGFEFVKDKSTGKYYYEDNRRTSKYKHSDFQYDIYNPDTSEFYKNCIEYKGDEQIVLTVLDYQDATAPGAFDDNKYVWAAFEETHPNIKIEREPLYNEPFHQKTVKYAYSEKMPDVFYMWPAGRSSIIHEKKLAKDLTPLLKRDGLYDYYSKICLNPDMQKSGYVAEIPFGLTVTNCMFANTKVLAECGLEPATTYEELKAQLPVLKAAGKELIIMANQEDWVTQACLFSMIVGRMAGANWADDIINGKSKFTDAPFKSAVRMLKRMYDDGVLSQISLATSYVDVPYQFASEKGAYLIDGDWRVGAFMTDASTGFALIPPYKQEADIELIQFPALPGEKYPLSNSGTLGVGYGMSSSIPDGSAKEAAAWELIKWLSGPEMQQRRLDIGASFPSLKEFISYDGHEPIVKKRADFYYQPKTLTPVLDSVFSSGVASVANAKLQELGLGKVTVNEVCEAIQAAWEAE